jgi:hypothetical protein
VESTRALALGKHGRRGEGSERNCEDCDKAGHTGISSSVQGTLGHVASAGLTKVKPGVETASGDSRSIIHYSRISAMQLRLAVWLAMLWLALATGCASMERRPPPPSLDEIVQMSKDGVPAETIVERLRESRAVYRVSGSQLAKLHDEGVPEAVLDYIQDTYLEHVRWRERMYYEDRYYWDHFWMHGCIGCYYRPWAAPYVFPYYYW